MEQVTKQLWICSKCKKEITDEVEFVDNEGVCDDCFSIPIKKRIGKLR
jgi:DNA-directed RNA polymerase subunit RPC12/RpoP